LNQEETHRKRINELYLISNKDNTNSS